jgi:stage V sporulation protein G
MQITNVKVRKTFNEGPMKAVVSVTFDNCFTIHDIKLIETNEKKFVVMPSIKTSEGYFRDIAHPIDSSFREALTKEVVEAVDVVNTIETHK